MSAAVAAAATAGAHFGAFTEHFCHHTQGEFAGQPFGLEPFQQEFVDEALEVGPDGHRVYRRAGLIIPRKNGKTTLTAALALYCASPADGEARPQVIIAAGSKEQAAEGYDQAKAFIDDPAHGSQALAGIFRPMKSAITCAANGGVIRRVAGDGNLNHSLNPHVVIGDELHAWKTPKQLENWKALTTAQGARRDPLVIFISTAGEGKHGILWELLERVRKNPETEVAQRRDGLVIYRNREARMLIYEYAVPRLAGGRPAAIDDVPAFKLANPASWRTQERLREDLADDFTDEPTKRRLIGNEWVEAADRWISDDVWAAARAKVQMPKRAVLALGADGARTRDTTALAWAWVDADGRVIVRTRVWSARRDVAHDVYVPGGRIDNDLVRDYVRDVLIPGFQPKLLFYDERYFDDQAHDLSNDGLTVAELHQGKPEMLEAYDLFYGALHEGPEPTVVFLDDGSGSYETLTAHVESTAGMKTERGWKVSKLRTARTVEGRLEHPIDAVPAAVMAFYGAVKLPEFVRKPSKVVAW